MFPHPSPLTERPHIVSTENGTADHQKGGASLGCIIHSSTNRTVVKFFKNGVEVQEDSAKFTLAPLLPKGNKTFENYLLVKRVDKGDEGCYECRIYINYTELIQVSTQDVYLVSTAGIYSSLCKLCLSVCKVKMSTLAINLVTPNTCIIIEQLLIFHVHFCLY